MTQERENEIQAEIDKRFEQFSPDEIRNADSEATLFGMAFPNLTLLEREFAQEYFMRKIGELRAGLPAAQKPAVPKGE